jgi:tripartite-type tricarboxylate transporter receptor subunit TctC
MLASLVLCGATHALAAKYPSKPVRLVVPFAAGGGNDVVARLLAERLTPLLGQPVVVENRAGAGGNIGTDLVAKGAPDGHTLLYVSNTVVMNPYLHEKLPFDVQEDLQPVGLLVTAPILVLVNPNAAIQSVGGLLKQGKERPGQLSYATPGNGTPHHFAMELLKARSGANLLHVPYKGAAPAVTDVLGGHVPVLVATPSSVVDFISSGRLRLCEIRKVHAAAQPHNAPERQQLASPPVATR